MIELEDNQGGAVFAVIFSVLMAGCGRVADEVAPVSVETVTSHRSHAPIVVEAEGTDFKWEFRTVGSDQKIGTGDEKVLGNELVVPPDTFVTLVLTSTDYVYTITVPDGRIAAAVPDMIHQIQFLSPNSGRFEFRTDPLCGMRYFHDDVLGTMRIAENDNFVATKLAR